MEVRFFYQLKVGETFSVDGERYTKHDEMVYTDVYGLQHYIDPLFDAKLGKELHTDAVEAPTVPDTSATIVKDVENE